MSLPFLDGEDFLDSFHSLPQVQDLSIEEVDDRRDITTDFGNIGFNRLKFALQLGIYFC